MTTFATVDALRESLARPTIGPLSPEYVAKMMHDIPRATVVDRHAFILGRISGKRVLEFGASGALHEQMRRKAVFLFGVDRASDLSDDTVIGFDLDDVLQPRLPGEVGPYDVIVCGEVLEHLGNPQYFLHRLKTQFPDVPVILSVPNAFSAIAGAHLERGVENVNKDHVCWYSYRTLRTLLERVGYTIEQFHWYGGEPLTAEGLIVVAR